jgi:hypothetical protein
MCVAAWARRRRPTCHIRKLGCIRAGCIGGSRGGYALKKPSRLPYIGRRPHLPLPHGVTNSPSALNSTHLIPPQLACHIRKVVTALNSTR